MLERCLRITLAALLMTVLWASILGTSSLLLGWPPTASLLLGICGHIFIAALTIAALAMSIASATLHERKDR